jgi:hypothetical protein
VQVLLVFFLFFFFFRLLLVLLVLVSASSAFSFCQLVVTGGSMDLSWTISIF